MIGVRTEAVLPLSDDSDAAGTVFHVSGTSSADIGCRAPVEWTASMCARAGAGVGTGSTGIGGAECHFVRGGDAASGASG